MSMDKLWEIANTISAIAGLLISAILVIRFYIPYVIKRSAAVITGMTFFVIMTILYLIPVPMSEIAAYVIGITALCIASLLSERENIPQKIFLSLTIYMFLWISHSVTVLPWKLIGRITYMNNTENKWLQFILFIVALILYVGIENALLFLQIYITEKIFIRKNEQMEWLELTLLASPYVAIIAGYWISTFMSDAYESVSGQYFWNNYPVYDGIRTLFGIIAFFAVMTVMHSYQQVRKAREESMQNALVSKQIEELSGHIHTMETLYSDIRGLRHDVNDHIMILGNLLDKGENEEAVAYLKEWQNGFPMPEIDAKTGNPVTDIVISEKKREAEEAGITFTDDFHYPSSGKVESIDIAVILNNALSNAIRAASECENPRIVVEAWKNNNAFLIQVKNTYHGILSVDSGTGLPETSKDDKESHGYGLINMKKITEKYYGTIQIEQDQDMVVFTAMMMIPE